jgi:hypothetical protein
MLLELVETPDHRMCSCTSIQCELRLRLTGNGCAWAIRRVGEHFHVASMTSDGSVEALILGLGHRERDTRLHLTKQDLVGPEPDGRTRTSTGAPKVPRLTRVMVSCSPLDPSPISRAHRACRLASARCTGFRPSREAVSCGCA